MRIHLEGPPGEGRVQAMNSQGLVAKLCKHFATRDRLHSLSLFEKKGSEASCPCSVLEGLQSRGLSPVNAFATTGYFSTSPAKVPLQYPFVALSTPAMIRGSHDRPFFVDPAAAAAAAEGRLAGYIDKYE